MQHSFGLRARAVLVFVLFAAGLLLAVGVWSFSSGSRALQQARFGEMQALAGEKRSRIEDWFDETRARLQGKANSPALRERLQTLLDSDGESLELARRRLTQELATLDNFDGLQLLLVESNDGLVLASDNPTLVGGPAPQQLRFVDALTGPRIGAPHISSLTGKPSIAIAVPLRDELGRVLAALVGVFEIQPLQMIAQAKAHAYRGAEAFLLDHQGLFLTQPPLQVSNAVLTQRIDTVAMRRCAGGESGTVLAPDYRGITSLVAFEWLPEQRFCLISKIYRDEALAAVDDFGRQILAGSLVMLMLACLAALGLARTVEKPVTLLRDGIKRYAAGERGLRLPARAGDVIGELTLEYNRLADTIEQREASLREHAASLESVVAARTEEINQFFVLGLDLLCIVDIEGRFVRLNPSWQTTLGYPTDELIGRRFLEFVHADDRAASEMETARLVAGQNSLAFENRYQCKDGSLRWLQWQAAPATASGLIYATARDITDRKNDETMMRASRDAAQDASRAKSEFLANMSHEIRTPLNGVLGTLGLLSRSELSAQQRELVGLSRASGETLLTIINDLLDFAKIEAGKLSMESLPFDLLQVCEEVCAMAAPQASAKEIDLVLRYPQEQPRAFLGDPARIRQILSNLVTNALKFTECGHVLIDVAEVSTAEGMRRMRLRVEDSGIGIDPAKIDGLFEKFTQADSSTTRRFGGTGLGLAISRQLVELMGGKIGARSEPEVGSEFWFELPMPSQPEAFAPLPAESLRGVRALIVDDIEINRRVLHEQIVSWGLRNGSATTAAEALRMLRSAVSEGDPYRIAIIDHQMPDFDGEMLAQAISADAEIAGTRLLMLSSLGRGGDAGRLAALGVSAYLVKPARQSDLLNALLGLLQTSPAARSASAQPTEGPQNGRGARVLLVEDNLTNRYVASLMLSSLGCVVEAAVNGQEALAMLDRNDYALIFMDCEMPVMDGFTATAGIRARADAKARIPVIAVTAQAMAGDRERCLAAGMDDYTSKPVSEAAFAALLERWLPEELSLARGSAAPAKPLADGGLQTLDMSVIEHLHRSAQATNPALFAEILRAFCSDARSRLILMRDAVQAADPVALRAAAHALKGAAANLGARRMASLADQLQNLGREGRIDGAVALLDQLQANFSAVQAALEQRLSSSPHGS